MKQYIAIAVVVLALVLVISLISSSKSSKNEELQDTLPTQSTSEVDTEAQEPIVQEPEPVVAKQESKTSSTSTIKVGEDGLCEDYVLAQGQKLQAVGHDIIVTKIGSTAVRLSVDGEDALLNEKDEEYLGDGIRVGLSEDSIIYFQENDADNVVELRVGCKIDDNPNDKYVQQRGEAICEDLYNEFIKQYESCKESFDIE